MLNSDSSQTFYLHVKADPDIQYRHTELDRTSLEIDCYNIHTSELK